MDPVIRAFNDCHESLKELSEENRVRVFKLLFTHYSINLSQTSNTNGSTQVQQIEAESSEQVGDGPADDEIIEKTKIPESRSKGRSKKADNKSTKPESHLVRDLNLNPEGKPSLKDFYASYQPTTNMKRNLVFVYYLERVLSLDNIDINHVHTCYKEAGFKIPRIYQSLCDTNNTHGWVDTTNMKSLKVSQLGENYIEHDMKKSGV